MKKFLALLLSVLMVIGMLAACAPKDNADDTKPADTQPADTKPADTEPTEPAPTEKTDWSDVDFTIAWWGGDARAEMTIKVIEEFEKLYPGLEVKVDYLGHGDYYTKLNTYMAGNDLPDVIQMKYTDVPTYAKNGTVIPLDDFIASGIIDMTNVSAAANAAMVYEGKTWGMSTGSSAPCLIYDPAALEAAGVTMGTAPISYSEYAEICKAVYEATGAKGYPPMHVDYMMSCGEYQWALEGDAVGFTAQTMADFFRLTNEGKEAGYFRGDGDETTGSDAADIGLGTLWSSGLSSNFLESFEAEAGKELAICVSPYADNATNKEHAYMSPTMAWGISKDSEQQELAAAWINFFTNEQIVFDICGVDRGMPINNVILAKMAENATPVFQKVAEYLAYLGEEGHSMPLNPNTPAKAADAQAVMDKYWEEISYGLYEDDELETVLQEMIDEMNRLLQG